jgi:hypothetical protein
MKKKSSRYHCYSNVGNNEDSNVFSVKLLDILVSYIYIYIYIDLGIYIFKWIKKIKLDKVWKKQ